MHATTITTTVVKQTLTPITKLPTISMETIQTTEMTEKQKLSTHPVRPVVKPIIPQRKVTLEQTQLIDRLTGTDKRKDGFRSHKEMLKTIRM